MKWTVVGLGNPGPEYEYTRHNAGRIALEAFRERNAFSEWKKDKKTNALISEGETEGSAVTLVEPETYMNLSGESVRHFVKYPKDLETLIVVHDELDLALGTYKISFARGAGGHNGVQSLFDHLKSQDFTRVRIGVTPLRDDGTLKKPEEGEGAEFVTKPFQKGELETIKKLSNEMNEAIAEIIKGGHPAAQTKYN